MSFDPNPYAGADAPAAGQPAADAPKAEATFTAGQMVSHTFDDPYTPEDVKTTIYGFVVETATAEDGSASYVVAWLPSGTAQLAAGDLTAV